MFDVLPLRFGDCLSVGGREWVVRHWPVIDNMGHQVDKDPLSLGQAENDGIILSGDDGHFLPIDDPGGLVAIFCEQDLHVFKRVDRAALGHGCTQYCGQRTSIFEEMRYHNVIYTLRTSSRHGHHSGGIFGHEGLPDVIIGQVTLGTEDHVLLDAVQWLLSWLRIADEVKEPAVLLIHSAELLV